ncbi:uncharacterized protein DC041_0008211 [Schistosoma bovis]|uniref:Activator of basal transcription 1 n=1 Tax=Schistosoma bovis TaxID=6184 RepID=A0A430Q5V8_SCHBO|nr:uncharacterized protein DC041_0008211 [Schistosoma bovis]
MRLTLKILSSWGYQPAVWYGGCDSLDSVGFDISVDSYKLGFKFGRKKKKEHFKTQDHYSQKYRQYEEGWVEFLNNKIARRVAKRLNCTEVLGSKRNPWFGELWNIRFLKDTSWNDLFGAEREEEEQRRTAHDRDIVVAKHQARQFSAALDAKKLEKKMKQVKGKRFTERKPVRLNRRQKLTEDEIKEKLAHSSRTPPEGCLGFSALFRILNLWAVFLPVVCNFFFY